MTRTLLTSLLLITGLAACGDRDSDLFSVKDGDCDDENAAAYPGNEEICDGIDNDCDGEVDNGASDALTFYRDSDSDGFGDAAQREEACAQPDGFVDNPDDCDDSSADTSPTSPEVCGGGDENCDGSVDEAGAEGETDWWNDADDDGFGDLDGAPTAACEDPSTRSSPYADNNTDCDDDDPLIHPDAFEICDDRDVDEDCDGLSDDLDDSTDIATMFDWYADVDLDRFGDANATPVPSCDEPLDGDYVRNDKDCDDTSDAINPDAVERCNDIDDDCDENTPDEGSVVFEDDATGTFFDETAAWGAGTDTAPADLSLNLAGTYHVCTGEYFVDIDIDADVTLMGVKGAEDTVLSGADTNTIVTVIADGLDVSIEGLTLEDGWGDNNGVLGSYPEEGGALYCQGESTVTITDSLLTRNFGDLGGALLVHTCEVSLIDSTVEQSDATFGGAALVWAGGTLNLEGSTFDANQCTNSGGGVYVQGDDANTSVLNIEDSMFTNNSSLYGSGIALLGSASATCTGTTTGAESGFHGNEADGLYQDSAVAIINLSNEFEASLCDFGEADTEDDNSTDDVSTDDESEAGDDPRVYAYGDDASFTCTELGCE